MRLRQGTDNGNLAPQKSGLPSTTVQRCDTITATSVALIDTECDSMPVIKGKSLLISALYLLHSNCKPQKAST